MNVLAITGDYPPAHGGGYGLHMSWFCEGLAARGHYVRVLTTAAASSRGDERDLSNGVSVSRHLRAVPDALNLPRLLARTTHNARAVRRAVRRASPDVVFCGAFDGIGFSTYEAALRAMPASLTWLGDTWLGQAWRDLPRYDRLAGVIAGRGGGAVGRIIRRSAAAAARTLGVGPRHRPARFGNVAALSEFVRDDLLASGAPAADVPLVPVSLHPAFFAADGRPIGRAGPRAARLRALFVGRFEPLKGPDVAVCGLAAAVRCGADVGLTFAGLRLDEMRPELTRLAVDLGVADRIEWAGTPPLDDLVALYRRHDVFLFPSRIVEGLGVVNCEAMACGLPVIGTAHSGSAEVIIDGKTGLRVPAGDSDAVGRGLALLAGDRVLLEHMSVGAMAMVERFRSDHVLDRLEAELRRAAGRGGRVSVPTIAIAASGLGHVSRGIEAWADDLAAALAARNVPVRLYRGGGPIRRPYERVVANLPREGRASRRLRACLPNRIAWRLGLGSGYQTEQLSFALALLRTLRRDRIDVLHVQDPLVARVVQAAATVGLVRMRVVLGNGTEESDSAIRRVRYLQHLAPWHMNEARSRGVSRPGWTAIPNFIDTTVFSPPPHDTPRDTLRAELGLPPDAVVVITAAAIKRGHKRIDHLISEFADLRRRRPELPLYLVVAGGHEADTDALVAEGQARLADRVRFLVCFPRERMPLLYRTADVFVLASLKEMMPIALLEAGASGLPCVVNDHPVLTWMAGPGGVPIDMAAPGALAEALAVLTTNVARRHSLGLAAAAHVRETFGRDRVVDRLLAYYAFVQSDGSSEPLCRPQGVLP